MAVKSEPSDVLCLEGVSHVPFGADVDWTLDPDDHVPVSLSSECEYSSSAFGLSPNAFHCNCPCAIPSLEVGASIEYPECTECESG